MYFSGSWQGYWEQVIWGRQAMRDLVLRFDGGLVEGEGVDVIGRFTFVGEYDAQGNVTLVKQYLGKHAVMYRGQHDGEGTIFGRWSISAEWSGPFALRPTRFEVPTDAPILSVSALPPRPAPEEEGVLQDSLTTRHSRSREPEPGDPPAR